jgi:hypothetical protein
MDSVKIAEMRGSAVGTDRRLVAHRYKSAALQSVLAVKLVQDSLDQVLLGTGIHRGLDIPHALGP